LEYPGFLDLRMRLCISVILIASLYSCNSEAKPKLTFSSLVHPKVKSIYRPLILSVYQELGIEIEIVEMLDERENISIVNGVVDGAIAKSGEAIERYPTMIKVQPRLVVAARYLFCQNGLLCSRAVLQQPNKSIGMTIASYENWGKDYLAKTHSFGTLDVLRAMFLQKRLDYIVYSDVLGLEAQMRSEGFQIIKLGEMEMFHVLARAHKSLAPRVSAVLKRKLVEQSLN